MKNIDFTSLKKAAKQEIPLAQAKKIAILGDCATQHLATAIKGMAYLRGSALDIYDADFNQIFAQIMDEGSELHAYAPDLVLIVMCVEKLQEAYRTTAEENRTHFAEDTARMISRYWDTLSIQKTISILQFNFVYFSDGIMGSYALREPSSFPYQLQKLNYLLSDAAVARKNVFLIDLSDIHNTLGRNAFCDDKLYYAAKMPFSLDALPKIAARTIDVIEALRGHVKKCVVLDLDNTLWGGVIGDDGLDGIQIGELGAGHAFTDFQCWLKELKKRGILLAVCSKNNEDTAKEPFIKHPEMVLRLDDFVMFVANWEDKASNILNIQKTLNIGMDSIVFLDDNPFEREQVRSMIPTITAPDMPQDPAAYVSYLQSLNLFEAAALSAEDKQRTAQYRKEAERATMISSFDSYDDYLKALEMRAVAAPFDPFNYPRIAQLTQRSNQFNLRTVRYTEAQIEEIAADDAHITRYYTLKDKLGDYGVISVVILDKQPNSTLFISEWLMSCRVLKRGMEEFIINDIMETAKQNGATCVVGEYVKTPKNSMVEHIYAQLGFTQNGSSFVAKPDNFILNKTFISEEKQ